MSAGLAGAVACAYAGGVIGLHRLNVYRLRKQAGFYPTLAWLDWQALLSDVFTVNRSGEPLSLPRTLEGGPSPEVLQKAPLEGCCAQHELLCSLTQGRSFDVESIEPAGFSGGEERWLRVLATVRSNPLDLIARFDRTPPASVAEVVLHEWLRLTH